MKVTPFRTPKILPGAITINDLLDDTLTEVTQRSIVVVTSKVLALCENNVVPIEGTDRVKLLQDEADLYYVVNPDGDHEYNFTIKQRTLIPASGIDTSNGDGNYILWPKDSIASANAIHAHLREKYGVDEVGVIITDSTIGLSRWGTLGIAIGHSGFEPVKNYIGQPDIFGRPMMLSKANIAGGLAAAAVFVMGEGAEQTPIAVIEDLPSVEFWKGEDGGNAAGIYYISPLDDDPFKPFFKAVTWKRGGKYKD